MKNYSFINIPCNHCKKEFRINSMCRGRARLCPDCRKIETLKQCRENNRNRYPHPCQDCGKIIYGHNAKSKRCRQCLSKLGYREWPEGRDPHRYEDPYGYIIIYAREHQKQYSRKNTFIQEHRLVAEQSLKRPLEKGEIVHHINGVKDDNRICNLSVMSRKNHGTNTLLNIAQKRIRELEAILAQQRLC